MADKMAENRRKAGQMTRQHILRTAARLATVHGLEGLSIGGLADEAGMSKSGLYAHFRSKAELQLATIDTAREIFAEEVFGNGYGAPEGRQQLIAVCEAFLSYVERRVFPGGCFFYATAVEVGALTGPVRDKVIASHNDWRQALEQLVRAAQATAELTTDVEPRQLAFEIYTLLAGATIWFVLQQDNAVLNNARVALGRLLGTDSQD